MEIVRPRILLGACAWLLGAALATVGSLYAVGQLGTSLFAVPSKPLTVKMVNAELAREHAKQAEPQPETTKPSHRPTARHSRTGKPHPSKHQASPSQSPTPTATPTPTPTLNPPGGVSLNSPDGSAQAACEGSSAYLLYWSAQPGYEADQVNRGPAAVAFVTFSNNFGNGIELSVTCQGGLPVKHLSKAHDT
jgi:hypothetical protein